MQPDEIRDVRERMGLSQTAFGKKLGVSLRTVQNYEKGETIPGGESLLKIMELAAQLSVDRVQDVAHKYEAIQTPRGLQEKMQDITLQELFDMVRLREKDLENYVPFNRWVENKAKARIAAVLKKEFGSL